MLLLLASLVAACDGGGDGAAPSSTRPPGAGDRPVTSTTAPVADGGDLGPEQGVLVAAGDIACAPGQPATSASCQMAATAELAASLEPDVVAPLGDLQYERGSIDGFTQSYDPTWGRLRDRTRPAVGNHEYAGGHASGYFRYFGPEAGEDGRGWYSYDIGTWHVVVLNSNCRGNGVGGCGPGSPQAEWLASDLRASGARCTLAYWHHPRYSSGLHGGDPGYETFWTVLDDAGAEVVLGGHDHHYERFAPQGPAAAADPDGVRQFVVGTGGRSLYPVIGLEPNSEEHDAGVFGVLELRLHESGYRWHFRSTNRPSYADQGSAPCR